MGWVREQVLAELALVNRKLDRLVPHEQVSTSVTHSTCRGFFDVTDARQPKSKLNAIRIKVRAIGLFIASWKRTSQQMMDIPKTPIRRTPRRLTQSRSLSRYSSKDQSWGPVKSKLLPRWDHSADIRMKKIRHILSSETSQKSFREKVWQVTDSPYSSKLAFMYSWVSYILVLGSVLVAFLHLSYRGDTWSITQIVFESLFALEFLVRLCCCPRGCAYIWSFFNIIDFLSVVPLAFRFAISSDLTWFPDCENTLLSLVPMLCLLKLLRRFEKLQLLQHAFEMAFEALPALLYILILLALTFSELIFFVEPRDNIRDLPTAIWFTIVTMTTVGYGEYTPVSVAGHIVASALIIISALYMAMPIGIVGNAFSEVWSDRDRLLAVERFRSAFAQGGLRLQALKDIFGIFDEDDNGHLDVKEFGLMLNTMQMNISEERVSTLYQVLDRHGEGHITLEALVNGLGPKAFARDFFQEGMRSFSVQTKTRGNLLG